MAQQPPRGLCKSSSGTEGRGFKAVIGVDVEMRCTSRANYFSPELHMLPRVNEPVTCRLTERLKIEMIGAIPRP